MNFVVFQIDFKTNFLVIHHPSNTDFLHISENDFVFLLISATVRETVFRSVNLIPWLLQDVLRIDLIYVMTESVDESMQRDAWQELGRVIDQSAQQYLAALAWLQMTDGNLSQAKTNAVKALQVTLCYE